MESSIFFGGSIFAAVIAGAIALFAPCCISFMLPAYFASSFQNRLRLIGMTFVFAAGIASVILPITMGASVLRQLLATQHMTIYIVGGIFLLGLALYLLSGGQIHLPMIGRQAGGRAGVLGVYTLGVFSGITSSCCAPVLAGVIALSSVAPSFLSALELGTAYVFGMVAPLFVISLLWEHYDWKSSRLFHPRSFTWHLGPISRTMSLTNLISGLLLFIMGVMMLWIGFTMPSMAPLTGWQATLAVTLQHDGRLITSIFSWVPNWVVGLVLTLALTFLAWRALREIDAKAGQEEGVSAETKTKEDEARKEKTRAY